MNENAGDASTTDYTLNELLEQAKNDESWEPDEKVREQLVTELERVLNFM